jgi:quercetin dioxygenase-like cupin family protein
VKKKIDIVRSTPSKKKEDKMSKRKWLLLAIPFCILFVIVSVGFSAEGKKMAKAAEEIILTPDEFQWKEGPPAVPYSKIAILEGDPSKRGFFVMRIKLSAGTKIPAHVHKNVERVTVISGKFNLAMGDKPENPIVLPAGSYFSLRPNTVHNAWVDEETVLQISTTGPWTFKPIKKEAKKE